MAKTKGKFIFKSTFYSYCSAHGGDDPNCKICQAGQWSNNILSSISRFFYWLSPTIWRWWVNF